MENLQGTVEEAEMGSRDSAGEALASLWGKGYLGILWLRLLRKKKLDNVSSPHSLQWTKNVFDLFMLPCVNKRQTKA